MLPDVDTLRRERVKITLGTDSLASNHQLSILEEMLTLQEEKAVPFEELLLWATLNGAEFLNIDKQYGSLSEGKQPGIVLIEGMEGGKLTEKSKIKRLF
ncbi:5'-deoxyadenosine deaminase [compost metagenome]